jgi:hypothetical protein
MGLYLSLVCNDTSPKYHVQRVGEVGENYHYYEVRAISTNYIN